MTEKIIMEFNGQMSGLLRKLGTNEGREATEIVRKAVGLYSHFQGKYRGQTIKIVDEKGNEESLYFD